MTEKGSLSIKPREREGEQRQTNCCDLRDMCLRGKTAVLQCGGICLGTLFGADAVVFRGRMNGLVEASGDTHTTRFVAGELADLLG